MVRIAIAFGVVLSFLVPQNSTATTTANAKITDVRTDSSGFVIIGLNIAASSSRPSCSQFNQAYSLDTNTAGGKTMFSNLEAAMLAGLSVTVVGKHQCTTYPTLENVDYLTVWH